MHFASSTPVGGVSLSSPPRRSSTRQRMPSRPRFSVRRTSSGFSADWTSSSVASPRSSWGCRTVSTASSPRLRSASCVAARTDEDRHDAARARRGGCRRRADRLSTSTPGWTSWSRPTTARKTQRPRSSSGTSREGHLHLIREPGDDLRQTEWVTRMARLAAVRYLGADWVIDADADEFWHPIGGDFHALFAAIPQSLRCHPRSVAQLRPAAGRRSRVRGAHDGALLPARLPCAPP